MSTHVLSSDSILSNQYFMRFPYLYHVQVRQNQLIRTMPWSLRLTARSQKVHPLPQRVYAINVMHSSEFVQCPLLNFDLPMCASSLKFFKSAECVAILQRRYHVPSAYLLRAYKFASSSRTNQSKMRSDLNSCYEGRQETYS